ncbi:hypothetical protein WH7805_06041 [Synechococcus sp. WH 7805]|nr:hypothetical protein WH7805_06041 [Synechococcus sp. WH 7805]
MISSVILASAVTMSVQLSNSTVNGMQRMDQRARVDSAMAAHMEKIRDRAFEHLCIQGCDDSQLTQQLKYDLSKLKPLCETNSLGSSLVTGLQDTTRYNEDLTIPFNIKNKLETAGSTSSVTSVTITPIIIPTRNQINVTLSAGDTGQSVSTSIVPHAQGWCR